MAFVKWGLDSAAIKTQFSVDGVPLRQYKDMVDDQKRLVGLVGRMLACLDDERDASVIQEAHALLARIKGE